MIQQTSQDAFTNFKGVGKREIHYAKIKNALNKIIEGSAKSIAFKANISYVAVSRRMSELERKNIVKVVDVRVTPFYKTAVKIYSLT